MPLTVHDEILCEIGRIAVFQSHIEGQMAIFIWELLHLDEEKGNLITYRLRWMDLLEVLGSLLKGEYGAEHRHVKRLEKFRKDMNGIVPPRNNCIHSMWGFGSTLTSDSATRVKVLRGKSGGALLQAVSVTRKELQCISKKMEQIEWEISDIRVKVCYDKASARQHRT